MELERQLTAKEERFCYEYCIDLNATQAAIRAGYSPKSARFTGSRMLSNVAIKDRIKKMQANLSELAGITALKVLNEQKKIAFSSMSGIHETWYKKKDFENLPEEFKACISEIETRIRTEYVDGPDGKKVPTKVGVIRVKLYDKQKALDSISNILGFNAAIRNELSGKIDYANLTNEQLDQVISGVINGVIIKQNG